MPAILAAIIKGILDFIFGRKPPPPVVADKPSAGLGLSDSDRMY